MRHDDGVARRVQGQDFGELVAGALHEQRRRREAVVGQIAGPAVRYDDAKPHVRGKAHERPGVVTRTAHDELRRGDEQIEEHRAAADLVDTRLLRSEQLARPRRGGRIEVSRPQVAHGAVGSDDQPFPVSRYPFPVDKGADREGAPLVEQLPLPWPRLERGLDEHVHLPLAPHAQVPGCDLVRARAVTAQLGSSRPDHLQRHLPHVLLQAAAAHVAGRATVLRDEQLRSFVAVRRAPHPHDGGERGACALTPELGEAVEHLPRLEPLLHGRTLRLPA